MDKWVRFPAGVWQAFFLHSFLVFGAAAVHGMVPPHLPTGFVNPSAYASGPWIAQFIRWDAHWYTYLAEHGYTAQMIVFFPALPALIYGVSRLGLGYPAAGFLVCNLFALASYSLLYAVLRLDLGERQASRALLAYALMPTSFFLNSVYTESLFITFTLACIYFARRRSWQLAGIFAALAALTRNLGIFLFLFLLWEMHNARNLGRDWKRFAAAFLAPLALGGFMLYNYSLTGDVLAFAHYQTIWGREYGWPWNSYLRNLQLIGSRQIVVEPGMLLDAILTPAALAVLLMETFVSRFCIRPSYLLIGWLWLVIPLASTSPWFPLYSLSRFVLVIFPLYFWFGRLSSGWYWALMSLSAVFLSVCTILFVNWYWIG